MAIVAVLFDHFVQAGGFQPGTVGVRFFLLLSGFLITRTLARNVSACREDNWLLLKSFYGRRALRIWPLYYLLLLALVVVGSLAADKAFIHAAFLTNFYAAWLNSWDVPWFLAHVWTLAVQEQYYLVWPLLFIVLSQRSTRLLLAAMVALSLIFRVAMWNAGLADHVAIFSLPPASFDALAIGSLLALAHDRLVPYLHRLSQGLAVLLALYLGFESGEGIFKVAILPTLWLLPLSILTLSAFGTEAPDLFRPDQPGGIFAARAGLDGARYVRTLLAVALPCAVPDRFCSSYFGNADCCYAFVVLVRKAVSEVPEVSALSERSSATRQFRGHRNSGGRSGSIIEALKSMAPTNVGQVAGSNETRPLKSDSGPGMKGCSPA